MGNYMNRDIAILQLMQTRGMGGKTLGRILAQLNSEGRDISHITSITQDELVKRYGLKLQIAQALSAARAQAEDLAEKLERQSVSLLLNGTPNYPSRLSKVLGNDAPPVLFAMGNLEILEQKAVGFCGSRHASELGLRVTTDCAQALAEKRINVVSGYAHGVDLAAHRAALEAGGVTTFVLAEGILRFKIKHEVAERLTPINHVILSEFPPRLTWTPRDAMQRNQTICGLAQAVIVIESGLSGGTFAAGETALRLRQPLFVAEYAQPGSSAAGNQHFLGKGAQALRGDAKGKPNLKGIWAVLENGPNGVTQSWLPGLAHNVSASSKITTP